MIDETWNANILCVDDEPAILDYYREVLEPVQSSALGAIQRRRAARKSRRRGNQAPPEENQKVIRPSFRVITARSGEEAIEIVTQFRAEGQHFAGGFFDMKMPGGIDGLETIRQLRIMDPHLLCAVVTAYTDRCLDQISSHFPDRDQWMYFNKPFAKQELLQAAHHMVSGWNIRRSRRDLIVALKDSNQQLRMANEMMEQQYLNTIEAMAISIEARDPYTLGHSQRVARVACMLGQEVGVDDQLLKEMRAGFLLHDIGKIGVDDSILKKPGKLSRDEYEIMKLHPVIGDRILKPITPLSGPRLIVRHHHENWNGRGYPDGLAGYDIPVGARLAAIADTFDAITSNRHYRQASGIERAIGILESVQGKQHDPELSKAFVRMIRSDMIRAQSLVAPPSSPPKYCLEPMSVAG